MTLPPQVSAVIRNASHAAASIQPSGVAPSDPVQAVTCMKGQFECGTGALTWCCDDGMKCGRNGACLA